MPVRTYFDTSTAHVTEAEFDAMAKLWPALDDNGPRVVTHDYGAWVWVPRDDDVFDLAPMREHYPNVVAVLDHARSLDCAWVNFDGDAPCDDALPTFEW